MWLCPLIAKAILVIAKGLQKDGFFRLLPEVHLRLFELFHESYKIVKRSFFFVFLFFFQKEIQYAY